MTRDRLMRWCSLTVLVLAACRGEQQPRSTEGYVTVPGGRVWYRVVGDGPGTPLLVLHGGPGVPYLYLKPLAALANERKVVFYEQLGSGRSDHPSDTTLWTVARFIDELTRVRQALGLDSVHIYGHSWGTILAVEYMLTKPTGIRSLILGGPALSAARYKHDNDSLIAALLPDSIARILLRSDHDSATCTTPAYQAASIAYVRRLFAERWPWSADLDSAVRGNDLRASYTLFGGCGHVGPMQSLDLTPRLHEITVPVQFLIGRDDPTTPAAGRLYQQFLPGSELVVFDSTGHLPMQDQPERYVAVMREFLQRVEGR